MKKSVVGGVLLALTLFGWSAEAAPISASAVLYGGNFIQSGAVTNNSVGLNIVQVTYSLGTAADGIASWEPFAETPAGFVRSDWLSGTNPLAPKDTPTSPHYQTISWSGLSIAPGATFSFSGLDIDLIVTLSPVNVSSTTIGSGTALARAYVAAVYNNGVIVSAPLVQQSWQTNQNLTLTATAVPEPASLLLLGTGLLGLALFKRRH